MGKTDDVMADILAAHASGISGADQGAERGAGNCGGFDAHLIKRLDHRDMGEPPRAAAAKRERKAFHAKRLTTSPRARIRKLAPQAAAPVALCSLHKRWSRCHRAPVRR